MPGSKTLKNYVVEADTTLQILKPFTIIIGSLSQVDKGSF